MTEPASVTPPPPGRALAQSAVARVLTVVGVLLVMISIAANFVERQALDSGELEETARQLIADSAIREEVASNLTYQLFTRVDVQAELERVLPAEQQALAGAISGALRPVAERLANEILERPRFQQVWVAALGEAQRQVVRVLDDEAAFVQTDGGRVTLDLRPLLFELTDQLPVVPALRSKLPPDSGVFVLFEADQLDAAQRSTRLLRIVSNWIWVLALAAWIAALLLARDRRREVRAIALGLVVVGVLLLVARRVAGRYLVDQLSTSASGEDAVWQTWDILTRLLTDAGWVVIGVGAVSLVGVWLYGSSVRGTAVRAWLAPYLRRPELAYGVVAVLYLLVLLWGPISYVRTPGTLLLLAVLGAFGVEALRRKARRDFPDARPGEPLAALRAQAERLRGTRPAAGPADELERLADLKERGLLTEEEFAAAKARVLV